MDFEARTKKYVTETIDPIKNRTAEDSKNLLRLNGILNKTEERLKLIEATLFKSD